MAAPMSTSLLAAELRSLPIAPDAAALFDPGLGDESVAPVFCVVGPSGAGKSALVNAIARADVATEGVLRPTTRVAAAWGSAPGGRLSDVEALGGSAGFALVDGPPSDRYPSRTSELLASSHLAVVVTSRDRYADASTRALLEEVRTYRLPAIIVLNRLLPATADLVMKDAVDLFEGWPLFALNEGALSGDDDEVDRLRTYLAFASDHASDLRAHRLHLAAVALADDARAAADILRRDEAARAALEADVRDAFRNATTGIDGAVDGAAASFDVVEETLCHTILRRASGAVEAAHNAWPVDREPAVQADLGVLADGDVAAIREWRNDTTALAIGAARPRWLGRSATARMEDQAWRMGVDAAFRPILRVRILLGRRDLMVRQQAATALDDVVAGRIDVRAGPFRAALRTREGPSPQRLEELAGEVVAHCPDVAVPIDLDPA